MSVDIHMSGEIHKMKGIHEKPEIDVGLLQMQILWVLGKGPSHGYLLMKRLSELKGTKVTQGTLYPTMQRLQELGLVESRYEKRKRIYSLTAKGKRTMKEACKDFCVTFQGIFSDFVCGRCGAKVTR